MPKWVWYVAAAIAVYYFFLRDQLRATGGANLSLTTGNNNPYGIPAGQGGAYGVAPTVGNPSGGTSISQDVLNYTQAGLGVANALGGILGQFGLGGSAGSGGFGPQQGGGLPDGWSQPSW